MNKQELAHTLAIKEEWLDKLDGLPDTAVYVRDELVDVVSMLCKRIRPHTSDSPTYDKDGHLWIGFAP